MAFWLNNLIMTIYNKLFLPTLFVFLFQMYAVNIDAQEITYVDTAIVAPVSFPFASRSVIDINGCVDSMTNVRTFSLFFTDIAFTFNEVYMYGVKRLPEVEHERALYGNTPVIFAYYGDFDDPAIEALATDKNGLLYAAGVGLSTYDELTATFTYLGDFPPHMQAGGDLTFRYGRLYMTTIENALVEVDIQQPMNSQVVMTFPEETPLIHGLATVNYSCDSVVTYALAKDEHTTSTVYELDFDSQSLLTICETDLYMYGAATPSELYPPDCVIYADLDADNSSRATFYDYFADTVCHSAAVPIVDEDVSIYCPSGLDSVVLSLSGVLDMGQEYLSFSPSANMISQNNNTTQIILKRINYATNADFEAALKNVVYQNDAANPTFGERQVELQLFASFYESEISTSYILLSNQALRLNNDTLTTACQGDESLTAMIEGTGGEAAYSFTWFDATTGASNADLSLGQYAITITDANACENVDTLYITAPDSLQVSIIANHDFVCGQTGTLTAFPTGGTAPYTFLWQTETNTSTDTQLGAGIYELTVTDANNCVTTSSFTLAGSDTIVTQQSERICEGDSFVFNNETYWADTLLENTFIALNGCDSIHQIQVEVMDTVFIQEQQSICYGDSILFHQESFGRDTLICVTQTSANGCDSTYCLDIKVYSLPSTLSIDICEGDSYEFGQQTLTQAGVYIDTLLGQQGCDSLVFLNLEVEALATPIITQDGNLCNGNSVELSAGQFEEYLWSNGATSPSIQTNQAGLYSVVVSSELGCQASAELNVAASNLAIFYSIDASNCIASDGGSLQIDSIEGGTAPYILQIDGQSFLSTDIIENLSVGEHQLYIEDATACGVMENIIIPTAETLTLELGEDIHLRLGDSTTIEAMTNATDFTIQWQPATFLNCDTCLSVTTRPTENIYYTLTLKDKEGCVVEDDILVRIEEKGGIYIPTAFSPNDDGINDQFGMFTDASVVAVHHFSIFDRWGNLIFERNNLAPNHPDLFWNGQFENRTAPIDVYTYITQVEKSNGKLEVLKGEVLLLR